MAEHQHEYMKAPEENIKTWNMVHHLMVYSGAAALILLLLLGIIVLR